MNAGSLFMQGNFEAFSISFEDEKGKGNNVFKSLNASDVLRGGEINFLSTLISIADEKSLAHLKNCITLENFSQGQVAMMKEAEESLADCLGSNFKMTEIAKDEVLKNLLLNSKQKQHKAWLKFSRAERLFLL